MDESSEEEEPLYTQQGDITDSQIAGVRLSNKEVNFVV